MPDDTKDKPTFTPLKLFVLQRKRGVAASWKNEGTPSRDLDDLIREANRLETAYGPLGVHFRILRALPAPAKVVATGVVQKRNLDRHSRSESS